MPDPVSSSNEPEQTFRAELIQWGIAIEKAAKVARVLALNLSNENLTHSEVELVTEVCQEWHEKRKAWERFQGLMAWYGTRSHQPTLEDYQRVSQPQEKVSSSLSSSYGEGL